MPEPRTSPKGKYMTYITKPNNVTAISDWSWKEKTPFARVKPKRISRKQLKRAAQNENRRYICNARRQAHVALKNIGQPILCQLDNRDLANRLWGAGIIKSGPHGKKTAAHALVTWYRGIDSKDRIKKKPKAVREFTQSSKDFLSSWEWTNLRYRALQLHGRKCQCCGAKPPDVVLHVDHIKPRSKYPELSLSLDNLQILCAACNKGKSNVYEDDFRQ